LINGDTGVVLAAGWRSLVGDRCPFSFFCKKGRGERDPFLIPVDEIKFKAAGLLRFVESVVGNAAVAGTLGKLLNGNMGDIVSLRIAAVIGGDNTASLASG
jgi:hypothetical protein